MRLIDLTGKRFGRLVCVSRAPGVPARWFCRCDCGGTKTTEGNNLRKGLTASCGCLHREVCRNRLLRHGKTRTRVYYIWNHMLRRCAPTFPGYGDRGITVCRKWRESFEAFLADMGEPPPGHSLDRKNNNGNYTKRNCRWATPKQQNNNRRDNHVITFRGHRATLAEHCERERLHYAAVAARIRKLGWSTSKALSTPIRHFSHHRA